MDSYDLPKELNNSADQGPPPSEHDHNHSQSEPSERVGRRGSTQTIDGADTRQTQSRERRRHGDEAPHNEDPQEQDASSETAVNYLTGDNLFVSLFGIVGPVLSMACWGATCLDRIILLLLKHPVEMVAELALLINIPLSNFLIMSAFSRKDLRHPLRNGIMIGTAIGISLVGLLFCITSVALGYPVLDNLGNSFGPVVVMVGLAFLSALATSIYSAIRLRSMREFRSARKMSTLFSVGGIITALLVICGAEARPFLLRIAEYNANSEVTEERDAAVKTLNALAGERDLRMECADMRAAGIPGMFIKLDPIMQRQAYFLLTGKPFRDAKAADYAAMPEDYLRRHLVGVPVENLSLVRSAMNGTIDGDHLTASLNWTFVLKNKDYQKSEARAELLLPHGAVVSGVSQWAGEGSPPRNAHVGRPGSEQTFISAQTLAGTDVTDLGHDRVLVRCTQIPPQSETKLSIAISTPLNLNDLKSASLTLPKLADSNFIPMSENSLRLRSNRALQFDGKTLTTSKVAGGGYLASGDVPKDSLTGATITLDVARDENAPRKVAVVDKDNNMMFSRNIVETKADAPRSMVVVIDGSRSLREHLPSIIGSLRKMPASMATSLLVASYDTTKFGTEPMPLATALAKLQANKDSFDGGQDNLQAVVKAAGIAGEGHNGAVLWIHGPQAGLNKELYITEPYTETPKFYEISVEDTSNDAAELFKNHREIGPFTTVTRTNNIATDLTRFLNKFRPGASGYELKYEQCEPTQSIPVLAGKEATDLVKIALKSEYERLSAQGHHQAAGLLAYRGNILTPMTSAVISFNSVAPQSVVATAPKQLESNKAEASIITPQGLDATSTPSLAEVTNGTIGPQGQDATYVTGVNTAGTVRVNNLANLEALLNILCNGFELFGLIGGIALMARALMVSADSLRILGAKLTKTQAVCIAVLMIAVALSVPGFVNWMVASARDANLFE
jgi:hypothetical protein